MHTSLLRHDILLRNVCNSLLGRIKNHFLVDATKQQAIGHQQRQTPKAKEDVLVKKKMLLAASKSMTSAPSLLRKSHK